MGDGDDRTFFTSKRFFSPASPLAPALVFLTLGAAPASVISTSAMLGFVWVGSGLDVWLVCCIADVGF